MGSARVGGSGSSVHVGVAGVGVYGTGTEHRQADNISEKMTRSRMSFFFISASGRQTAPIMGDFAPEGKEEDSQLPKKRVRIP
jgi:hypothetical protein